MNCQGCVSKVDQVQCQPRAYVLKPCFFEDKIGIEDTNAKWAVKKKQNSFNT